MLMFAKIVIKKIVVLKTQKFCKISKLNICVPANWKHFVILKLELVLKKKLNLILLSYKLYLKKSKNAYLIFKSNITITIICNFLCNIGFKLPHVCNYSY